MYIEELIEGNLNGGDLHLSSDDCCEDNTVVILDAKRILVGAGARALFYPTLLYNVVRNKIQSEFRWWDRVDEFILLGAVPFPGDVPHLKELGVRGVVTLNEAYETLVPSSLYHANNIKHLVIPTRDYLFAPSYGDICEAVEFIHNNASAGKTTYVHCKAGRGRSTTIVLCYLVEHKQMTPDAAYEYVKSIRPRIRLASSQWQAVQSHYYHCRKNGSQNHSAKVSPKFDVEGFEDELVLVTKSDLEGYDESYESGNMVTELSLTCRAQFASQSALARLSCLWLGRTAGQKLSSRKKLITAEQLLNLGADIRVY